jgi:YHS domain-containing protein
MYPHPLRSRRVFPGVAFVLVALFGCAGDLAAQDPEAEPIAWQDDYNSALDEARAAGRLLWIQFTGPWCPNCTRMERDSFPHAPVVAHARTSFLPLKLQADVNAQLIAGLGLTAIPASVIVAPNRDIIAIRQGYLGPHELDAFLKESLGRAPLERPLQKPTLLPVMAIAGAAVAAAHGGNAPSTRHSGAANEKPIALEGFCAVSLVCDRKLVAGRSDISIMHEGRTYRFFNETMSERFRKDPERFIPVNSGMCPVNVVERGLARPGDPRYGVLYRNHLFLCASSKDRQRFLEEPARFELADVAENGYCVHCIRDHGLLVPGDPQLELARHGCRLWFADSEHRQAFLSTER